MAVDENKIVETFFSHDKAARGDEKIVEMFFDMRKNKENFTAEQLKNLLPYAAYGLYWSVVEYMHRNDLPVDKLEMLADELRIDTDFLNSVMNNYKLFHVEDDYYISDRIQRNLEFQATKSEQKSKAAQYRWAMKTLTTVYKEIFNQKPVLSEREKPLYVEFDQTIPDFRKKLPDILYTLKCLKFKNNPDFNPSINWLLTENHLAKLLNGEYGKLKSWSDHKKAVVQAQKEREAELAAKNQNTFDIDTIDSKTVAIDLLLKNSTYVPQKNRCVINNLYQPLLKKFDITNKEITEIKRLASRGRERSEDPFNASKQDAEGI